MVGRNKRRIFSAIKDKAWKRVWSWKMGLFSASRREILVKAVLQVIPSYFMRTFKIMNALCNDLRSIFLRFWWGSSYGNKKVAWVPKTFWWFRFWDLQMFNQALVGKQSWCLLNDSSSLASSILKDKYFPNGLFLSARDKHGSSYLWKTLLSGLEVIGKGVSVFDDPWLPRPVTFKPITRWDMNVAPVQGLISPSSIWGVAKLNQNFLPIDSELIQSTPFII
ncbi:hypothetical protein TorRG33x02_355050 [Trema orientale]|uniref:Uncharacterized protein n=1 Tax=Trema orientale TaxID=63057 RepID=A0A2P5A9Y8_TREOI|nr:hypothetical protein TorRG33x02_355050 [Trema orientale]